MKLYLLPAIKPLAKLSTHQAAECFLCWNYSHAGENQKKKKKKDIFLKTRLYLICIFPTDYPSLSAVGWERRKVPGKICVNDLEGLKTWLSRILQPRTWRGRGAG